MRFAIPKFDPTATTSGQVNNPLPQNQQVDGSYGFLLWANESSVSLLVQVNGDRFRIHPWELARIDFKEPTQFVQWAQEVILTNNASAPISLCLIDAYTPDEQISTAFPVPLVRNTNVGGTVTTAMTATLINDGSAAGMVIIETTPTGEATSAFSLDNSGNLVLRTLSSSVWSIIMQIISGGASPATALFHGTADTLATGLQATGVEIGTGALNKISMHDLGGNTNEVGAISSGTFATLAAPTGILQRYNHYSDGTNDRFMTANNAAQIAFSEAAFGGTNPHPSIRFSTNASPTAGAVVTWGAWFGVPFMSNNGLLGGKHIFTGTTSPSGMIESDLWFNG